MEREASPCLSLILWDGRLSPGVQRWDWIDRDGIALGGTRFVHTLCDVSPHPELQEP